MATILLVEDDKKLGNALQHALEEAGYQADWAQDAHQALSLIENNHYDLIYLDILLPDISGYDILTKVKQSETYKHIPVVMLSNLGQKEEIERATKLGATDYIVKADVSLTDIVEQTQNKYLSAN